MANQRKEIKQANRANQIKSLIGWEDYLGLAFIGLGILSMVFGIVDQLGPELIGIGVTVIIIENAYQIRTIRIQEQEEKRRLFVQMGSPDKAFAIEAVRQIKPRGWLYDGSLEGISLSRANLSGAILDGAAMNGVNCSISSLDNIVLHNAELQGANFKSASLGGALLSKADLSFSNFKRAVLTEANLRDSNLKGANFSEANLAGANLDGAIFDNTVFSFADLAKADISRTNMQNIAEIEKIWFGGLMEEGSLFVDTTLPDGSQVDDPRNSHVCFKEWVNERRIIEIEDSIAGIQELQRLGGKKNPAKVLNKDLFAALEIFTSILEKTLEGGVGEISKIGLAEKEVIQIFDGLLDASQKDELAKGESALFEYYLVIIALTRTLSQLKRYKLGFQPCQVKYDHLPQLT
jgi:uncharacterized protein YjbI with pentapeptide repeats